MTISRMQQPRQMYGLGSFVKKAVKGVTGAVKDVVKSDVGKAALLAAGAYYAPAMFGGTVGFGPGTTYGGFLRGIPGALKGLSGAGKLKGLGKTLGIFAGGSLLGGALSGMPGQDVVEMTDQGRSQQDIESIKIRLTKAYRELGYSEDQIPALVEADLSEYSTRGFADGGRIGYAYGDRAEDNAMQASSAMGLPLNTNPAGVKELDLRKTGGFIPPVGIKEKADDIPAMLSNNEFVMTADAVRNMGNGNVNKGAQRMYDMMKKLEKGGRV